MSEEATGGAASRIVPHLAWIASVTWFALVAVKALRVARMNSQTAIAILGSAEAVSVAFFVLVSMIPALSVILALWAVQWSAYLFANRSLPQRTLGVCLALLLLGVSIVLAPWFLSGATLVLLAMGGVLGLWVWKKGRPRWLLGGYSKPDEELLAQSIALKSEWEALKLQLDEAIAKAEYPDAVLQRLEKLKTENEALRTASEARLATAKDKLRRTQELIAFWFVITLSLNAASLFLAILSETPWRPSERLTINNGSSRVGYVVGEGDWTSVILENSRRILLIKSSTIASRTICDEGRSYPQWRRSIADWLMSDTTPTYPRCKPDAHHT
ncbi:MAG: hypothetical protein QOI54_878 [Actinomycetota bacterium]|jgi:hypothetical protein|nr:hypothetical protein [Actinomycetota bacterium]